MVQIDHSSPQNLTTLRLIYQMASTVDVLSHGRLTLGIGAGDFEQEFRAYGYACPPAPERLRQLREAVQIILAMWKEDEATFEGTYYQVRGAINQPKGVQHPHIPLLIGGTPSTHSVLSVLKNDEGSRILITGASSTPTHCTLCICKQGLIGITGLLRSPLRMEE